MHHIQKQDLMLKTQKLQITKIVDISFILFIKKLYRKQFKKKINLEHF